MEIEVKPFARFHGAIDIVDDSSPYNDCSYNEKYRVEIHPDPSLVANFDKTAFFSVLSILGR
jgi:hypothetical protein